MLRDSIFWVLLAVFYIGSVTLGALSYDYFYDLKMKECDSILTLEYDVATESVTNCQLIKVNKFWNYDLDYILALITLSVFFMFLAWAFYFLATW